VHMIDLADLIGRQPPGHSLLQPFYAATEIYRLDVDCVLRPHWTVAGHVSSIPNSGDYLVCDFDTDSAIVVRHADGSVRAHANVCRHRGSRLCSADHGHLQGNAIRCPYHSWTYNLDGSLRKAPWAGDEIDVALLGLAPLAVEVCQGLIFVSFAGQPLDFGGVRAAFDTALGGFGWDTAVVAHRERYVIPANWKLALENQVECYHCVPAHPEFARAHTMAQKGSEGAATMVEDRWAGTDTDGELSFRSDNPLNGDHRTGSEGGELVAPLMGPKRSIGRFVVAYAGICNHFLAYADYGCIFRYEPLTHDTTALTVTWLVAPGAKPGVDYDIDRLTWMWRVTAAADVRIVGDNARGVASSAYRPGPYIQAIEPKTARLTEWYLTELAAASDRSPTTDPMEVLWRSASSTRSAPISTTI
jgi:phenylpropionate dioxygenase-like ring-hydroxylating dioxygenase large terminal subunit